MRGTQVALDEYNAWNSSLRTMYNLIPFNDLYTQRRMDRYFGVIDNKPEKINNLNGWYDRIKKFYSSQDEFDRLYKSKKEDYFRKYKSFYTGK